jgi:hypothetical protein
MTEKSAADNIKNKKFKHWGDGNRPANPHRLSGTRQPSRERLRCSFHGEWAKAQGERVGWAIQHREDSGELYVGGRCPDMVLHQVDSWGGGHSGPRWGFSYFLSGEILPPSEGKSDVGKSNRGKDGQDYISAKLQLPTLLRTLYGMLTHSTYLPTFISTYVCVVCTMYYVPSSVPRTDLADKKSLAGGFSDLKRREVLSF